jgi:predicted RNA-binding Zn-ribbon protein involved in translation (DUF1610 family)
MKCESCGYEGRGWRKEGRQKLPKRVNDKVVWITYELWTCPRCGSTAAIKESGIEGE